MTHSVAQLVYTKVRWETLHELLKALILTSPKLVQSHITEFVIDPAQAGKSRIGTVFDDVLYDLCHIQARVRRWHERL